MEIVAAEHVLVVNSDSQDMFELESAGFVELGDRGYVGEVGGLPIVGDNVGGSE